MEQFVIDYDMKSGGVRRISGKNDKYGMNWVEGKAVFGTVKDAKTVSVQKTKDGIIAVYETKNLRVTVERSERGSEYFEKYRIKNTQRADVFINRGDFGIYATFNDNYELSEVCLPYRCHAHIWCGGEVSYVRALKMGLADYGLGLILTEGSLDCYSIERDWRSEDRGDFILHPSPFTLMPNEETVIAFKMFWYKDGEFFSDFEKEKRGIRITSPAFTVFTDETIEFTVNRANATVILDDKTVPVKSNDGKTLVRYTPKRIGEHKFIIRTCGITTKAEFYVQIPFEELMRSRIEFITGKQQFNKEGSPLDGAYLIYDNEDERVFFDNSFADRNASRERLVMGLAVAKYLQYRFDSEIFASLKKYYAFVTREFYDEKTGCVYDTVGMDPTRKRLYNAPWMAMFVMEMYKLTGEKSYLENMVKLLLVYYEIGAARFYPNGLTMFETIHALKEAGMDGEAEAVMEKFREHVGNIVEIGVNYPPHEVKYEQTIVSPGAALTAQMYMLTGDSSLINECKKQIALLERINGEQPSYKLNQLAIRHWDAYWFGKRQLYGDTFPHTASIHTSDAFLMYADISGDEKYREMAYRGMRNNLCLFKEDGRAYSSYVYPYKVNGARGEYYDPFSNEQDGALYFMIKYFGLLERKEK